MNKIVCIYQLIIVLLVGGCCNYSLHKGKSNNEDPVCFNRKGGEYTYANGITLKIPRGALNEKQRIAIKSLTESEMSSLANTRNIPKAKILFAFKTIPDDVVFESSVSLSIPVSGLTPSMMPLIMQIDFAENDISVANVSYTVDYANKTIELTTDHFSGYEAEIADEIRRNECTPTHPTSCRCGNISVTQTDVNYNCSVGDCQVLYSENNVAFIDCPGSPVESSIFEEVSPGCSPDLLISSDKQYIEPGETCEIIAQLKLGCAPISNRNVSFLVSGPGTISPVNAFTDAEGNAYATLTGGSDEGIVTITALSSFRYNTKRINVNGVDLVLEEQTADLSKSTDLYVINKPVMDLVTANAVILKNSNTTITATITRNEVPVEGALVDFSVVGPGDIDPFSASTSSAGQATSQLSSHGTTGLVIVVAESVISIGLPNGEGVQFALNEIVNVIVKEENEDEDEDFPALWNYDYYYSVRRPAVNEPEYHRAEEYIERGVHGVFRIIEVEKIISEGTPFERTVIEYQIEGSASDSYIKHDGATWELIRGFTQNETRECPGATHQHSATYQLSGELSNGRIYLSGHTDDYAGHENTEYPEVGVWTIEVLDLRTGETWTFTRPYKISVDYEKGFRYHFDEDENWTYLDYVSDDGKEVNKIWITPLE